jgi:hypothetical protein
VRGAAPETWFTGLRAHAEERYRRGVTSPMRRLSDVERERAAEILQRACADGRLTLEEFSARVGAVWAADQEGELVKATADLAATPIVGSALTVDNIVTILGETKRRGRWRLRTDKLKTRTVLGTLELDLREVLTTEPVIRITGVCAFGEIKITNYFASQHLRLAPRPRVPGTPEIRVEIAVWFGTVHVQSRPWSPHN